MFLYVNCISVILSWNWRYIAFCTVYSLLVNAILHLITLYLVKGLNYFPVLRKKKSFVFPKTQVWISKLHLIYSNQCISLQINCSEHSISFHIGFLFFSSSVFRPLASVHFHLSVYLSIHPSLFISLFHSLVISTSTIPISFLLPLWTKSA